MKRSFFDGWTAFASILLVIITIVAVGYMHTGDPHERLPESNWLWVALVYALVFSTRSYQYFIQKK